MNHVVNHVVIHGEGSTDDSTVIGHLSVDRDGWDWLCTGCQQTDEGYLSASAALADFERHVEERHTYDGFGGAR